MSRRLSLVLIAVAGLALLAGCGESEKQTYLNKMKSISKQLASDQKQTVAGQGSAPSSGQATRATQVQSVFNRLAKRYAEVKPPSKVKDLHQRLTVYVRSFADSLTPYIQAAKSGEPKRLQSAQTALRGTQAGFQGQLNSLVAEFKARGYKLG